MTGWLQTFLLIIIIFKILKPVCHGNRGLFTQERGICLFKLISWFKEDHILRLIEYSSQVIETFNKNLIPCFRFGSFLPGHHRCCQTPPTLHNAWIATHSPLGWVSAQLLPERKLHPGSVWCRPTNISAPRRYEWWNCCIHRGLAQSYGENDWFCTCITFLWK